MVNVADDGVPSAGVTSVGLVANTKAPEPVSSDTAAARFADDGVARNVATPVPRPEIPVDTGRPVTLVITPLAGVPRAGVTSVGLVANTKAPEPVSSVTAAAKLADDGVARNVATPVPKPETPVEIGRPVALVRTAEDGVPSAGATNVGLVANTKEPVPVSSDTAARKLAEVGVSKNVATPVPKDVSPVPPEAAASGEASVRLGRWSFWKLKLVPSDQTVTVLPAGITTPNPAAVVLPITVEL